MWRDVYQVIRERREWQKREEEERARKIERRQSRRFSILLTPIAVFTTVFTAALGVHTTKYLLTPPTVRQTLENDPQCGLTTGGQQECYWDCQAFYADFTTGVIAVDPVCLADCFPPNHCVNSLLEDFTTNGGICGDGLYASFFPNEK